MKGRDQSARWLPSLISGQCSMGTERFTAPGWHPQSHFFIVRHLFPDFWGISRLEAAPLVQCPCSSRAPPPNLIWPENGCEGRVVGTAWQMHNRVLFRVPSDLTDWPTRVEWPREIVCVCVEGYQSQKLMSVKWRRHDQKGQMFCVLPCTVSLGPLLFPFPGLQQLFDTLPWHFFDEREKKGTSCGCLVLHSQVDDSPPWCSITWMFCLPLGPVDSHNTVFCSHRLRPDSSVVFLRESK